MTGIAFEVAGGLQHAVRASVDASPRTRAHPRTLLQEAPSPVDIARLCNATGLARYHLCDLVHLSASPAQRLPASSMHSSHVMLGPTLVARFTFDGAPHWWLVLRHELN